MSFTVTIFVLNWNSRDYLEDCLSALLAAEYEKVKIVVIDNASTDGSMDFVSGRFPTVTVIGNEMNLGFAGGNNVGLRSLDSEIAVLVNPDAIVTPGLVSDLVDAFQGDERIGIAGCKTFYPNTDRLQHAGGFIEYPRAVPGHFGIDEIDDGQYDELVDVEYVTGAIFAIRRKLLDDIGLFDPGYFLYYEEADLCRRARNGGYRVVLIPGRGAEHHESAVAQKGSRFFHNQLHKSRWRYLVKHHDLDDLMGDTIPAEKIWLENLDPVVRAAVSFAYRETILYLDSIFERREEETGERTPDSEVSAVKKGLEDLRRVAIDEGVPAAEDLRALSDLGEIREKPFQSNVPLFGSVIAGARELWSRVAVKPFVRPLLEQQNAVNQKNLERFAVPIAKRGEKLGERLGRDRKLAALASDLASLNETVARMTRRLDQVDRAKRIGEEDTGPNLLS